jgi:beta-glucanase (GH16 family)
MVMVLDPWTESPNSSFSRDPRSGRKRASRGTKRTRFIVSGVLAAALVVGVAVAAKAHLASSGTPAQRDQKIVAALPSSWTLKLNASFTGNSLDTKVWDTCYPWQMSGAGCTNFGNSNEVEWYTAAQDRVGGGVLNLVSQLEPTSGLNQKGAHQEYECRSGMVTSYPGFDFEYGLVQITAKIPFGDGLWPALWLAASNKQWPPEVDILEHWNGETQAKVYLHPATGARQGGGVNTPNLGNGWHTFTVEWTSSQLTWYYDGTEVFSTTTGIPHQAMYLIMNLADTSTASDACNASMAIKSVKVWGP